MDEEQMPEYILVIPIKVDTILVHQGDKPFAQAKMDFSKLPYNDGKEDVNTEFAYLSENFLSQPFQNNNLFLRPGLHLHWALPDAYTGGEIPDSENGEQLPEKEKHVTHTQVPDRWVINRKKNGETKKSWVVESNYLHPEGKDNKYHAIAYPIEVKETGQPFRYMGRSYCFYDNAKTKEPSLPTFPDKLDYLDGLTAVGYGEHTFAGFYPNCHSVFGFCDTEIKDNESLENIEYEVLGWYSKAEYDPLFQLSSSKESGVCNALNFDGADDTIEINAEIGNFGNGDFSIELFIKTTLQSLQYLVSKRENCAHDNFWNLYVSNDGKFGVELDNNGNHYFIREGNVAISDGKWHHLAVCRTLGKIQTFVDGAPDLNGDCIADLHNSSILKLGNCVCNSGFNGEMSEVRIWNESRTPEQIQANANSVLIMPQAKLLAYYIFNQPISTNNNPSNTVLIDISGNENHGTLKGFNFSGDTSNWVTGSAISSINTNLNKHYNFSISNFQFNLNLSSSLLSLCFASINFKGLKEEQSGSIEAVAIGNTGTEALSALLAIKIPNNNKVMVEEELEALQLLSKVAGKKLDIDAAFDEAYHEKGFSTADGGSIYTLRIESVADENKPNKGKKQGIELSLPDALAHWLNNLNKLQQQFDRANDELKSLQQQLYADWSKYMMAAYHPDIEKELPHMDDVRFFISNNNFKLIDGKKKEINDIKARIGTEQNYIHDLIILFNSGNKYEKLIYTDDGALDFNKSGFHKLIPTLPFSDLLIADEHTENEKGLPMDNTMEGIPIKHITGLEAGVSILKNDLIKDFCAISFWVNISSHQPLGEDKKPLAGKLIQLLDENNHSFFDAEIDKDTIGRYWQSICINGLALDPYEVFTWKEFPKDQWIHVYLQGAYKYDPLVNIILMKGLKGMLAGINAFNAGLTSMELFCDQNMLQLKELKLVRDKGPRYWQPNEPVVLLAGDKAKPSSRYGFDGDLPCFLAHFNLTDYKDVSFPGYKMKDDGDQYRTFLLGLSKLPDNLFKQQNSFKNFLLLATNNIETLKPWNPLILEWKVGIIPLNVDNGTVEYSFPEDIITQNFVLEDDKPDLIPSNSNQQNGSLKIFSGSTILTPHAKDRMTEVIERYLESLHEDDPDWDNYGKGKPNPFINPFINDNGKIDTLKIIKPDYTFKPSDSISIACDAYNIICGGNFLSQSLGGFNAALLMHHQTFQLPVADPIGFKDDQAFTSIVKENIERESKYAPLPLFEFDPIRTGTIKIIELSIIDSFGRIEKVYDEGMNDSNPPVIYSRTMEEGYLPPRIVQPARINFRWLSANNEEMEMNDHPASSPVCGWLVPNNLDENIMVYDQDGNALGSINDSEPRWRSAPGTTHPIVLNEFKNIHLKDIVKKLLGLPDIALFMDLLEATLDQIDPENFAMHTDLAMLMGKPIAVVRASVGLEIKGNVAINQGWDSFRSDMNNVLDPAKKGEAKRTTNDWEKIKFPVRVGEHGQLNDGVLGFWRDDAADEFHSVVSITDTELGGFFGDQTKSKGFDALAPYLQLSPSDQPISLTLLMDPRGKAHGTVGVLPAKAITIPDDQFKASLKKMSITFFTRPLLMPAGKTAIPLPNENGYSWSWLVQQQDKWIEVATTGIVHQEDFEKMFKNGDEIWQELIKKGWIEETEYHKAEVMVQTQRKDPDPHPLLITQLDKIQQLLDAGHIVDEMYEPDFSFSNVIKEGWLKLTPTD